MPPSPSTVRRLTAVALATAPAVVLLASPAVATTPTTPSPSGAASASAAADAVRVTATPDRCGITLRVSGLDDAKHTVTVTVTRAGSDASVGVQVEDDTGAPTYEPKAVRTLPRDGVLALALDPRAVPDASPEVRVSVALDGGAPTAVELVLPDCAAPASPPPTTPPPTTPPPTTPPSTTPPTVTPPPATGEPDGSPATSAPPATSEPSGGAPSPATGTPSPSTSPGSGSPSPTSSPTTSPAADGPRPSTGTPTPGAGPSSGPSLAPSRSGGPVAGTTRSPRPSRTPVRAPGSPAAAAAAAQLPAVPLAATAVGGRLPAAGVWSSLVGHGSTGYLALSGLSVAPQAATAATAVPAPVIAGPLGAPSPLAGLLPQPTAGDALPPELPVLAQPAELASSGSPDPAVELGAAAFVLAASVGGWLLSARRRRRA